MLFYKLLLTRFIGMILVLLIGACSLQTTGPNVGTEWQTPVATSLWDAIATQTSQGTNVAGTLTVGTPTPGGGAQGTPSPGAPLATPLGGPATALPAGLTPLPPVATLPLNTRAPGTPAGTSNDQPVIVVNARTWVAQQLKFPPEQVVIQNFEHVQWPDTCLGLGQAGMGCAQVVTPGWRIVFYADGTNYEVRTDETGQIFRLIEGGKG